MTDTPTHQETDWGDPKPQDEPTAPFHLKIFTVEGERGG